MIMGDYGRFEYQYEAVNAFREFLDELYPQVELGGYTYDHSTAFERTDPVAFREEFNNWLDYDTTQWHEELASDGGHCDECDSPSDTIVATDDGRALVCPSCKEEIDDAVSRVGPEVIY